MSNRLSITESEPGKPGYYRITIDDTDITRALTSVNLSLAGGEPPRALLDVLLVGGSEPIVLDGVELRIPPSTHAALVAMGWTPPADDTDTAGEATR